VVKLWWNVWLAWWWRRWFFGVGKYARILNFIFIVEGKEGLNAPCAGGGHFDHFVMRLPPSAPAPDGRKLNA